MTDRDWLFGWNERYARVLAETGSGSLRAALVDTNGDGRELWFGIEMRSPSGDWHSVLDWDDVGGHQPPGKIDHVDALFGWGTGYPRERKLIEVEGHSFVVRVGDNGWWILAEPSRALASILCADEFLVCYDYGMGGLWGVLVAPSEYAIKEKYPELVIADRWPPWLEETELQTMRSDPLWIDSPPTGLLLALVTDR